MKKAMSFNPLDHNGRFTYVDKDRSIGAIMYEYGTHFGIMESDLFKKSFYPLSEDYYEYRFINFEPKINPYIDLINQIKPQKIEHHYFLAIFLTYFDIFSPGSLYVNSSILKSCLEHSKYFVDKCASNEDVELWYKDLVEKLIH